MKKLSDKNVEGPSGTANGSCGSDVEDGERTEVTGKENATSENERRQTAAETVAKPKRKRSKTEDGRSCRRVADVEQSRKEANSEGQKPSSAKASTKMSEVQTKSSSTDQKHSTYLLACILTYSLNDVSVFFGQDRPRVRRL